MITPAQSIERAFAQMPDVASMLAVYLGQGTNAKLARVQFGIGAPVDIPSVGIYPPWPGDSVQIERRNGQLVMTGPTVSKPAMGKITATGSPRATVLCGGTSYTLPLRSGYVPAVGDDVTINWVTQIIEGKVTAVTAPPSVDPGNGGAATPFEHVFMAHDSGTWNGSRYFTNDVWASDSTLGLWVTGYPVPNTLADNAVISSIEIYLNPRQTFGGSPVFGVVDKFQLDGPPSFVDTIPVEPRSGWVALPVGWGNYARNNLIGIGTNHGGYNIWFGNQADGLSGALRIRGTS